MPKSSMAMRTPMPRSAASTSTVSSAFCIAALSVISSSSRRGIEAGLAEDAAIAGHQAALLELPRRQVDREAQPAQAGGVPGRRLLAGGRAAPTRRSAR